MDEDRSDELIITPAHSNPNPSLFAFLRSIVHVHAKNSESDLSMPIYDEKPDVACDANDGKARLTRVITPWSERVCNTPFLANRIRVELDTRAVEDWNELLYVKLTGYEELPAGVIPSSVSNLTFTPDQDYFGLDKYSLYATDCGYLASAVSSDSDVFVGVEGIADSPIVKKIPLDVGPENATITIDVSDFVVNLDGFDLKVRFVDLPSIGFLRTAVGTSSDAVTLDSVYDLATTFTYGVVEFPVDFEVISFQYEVIDAKQDLTSKAHVEVSIQGVPKEKQLPLWVVGLIVGVGLCFVTFLAYQKHRINDQNSKIEELASKISMMQE